MARTLMVDAVGSRILIDLGALSESDEAAVRAAWVDAATRDDRAPTTMLPVVDAAIAPLEAGPLEAGRTTDSDPQRMLSRLSQRVTLAAIGAARGRAWMLHAAGIATADGQVVALVGPSGRGKTTAVRALATEYAYVSDETVAIAHDGTVLPYLKPLSLVSDHREAKTQLAASALGLMPLPDAPLRIASIVLLDRDPRHPEAPVVEVTDVGEALGTLVSETSFLHDQPAPLRHITALAAATGGFRTVRYREATTLASVIPDLVRRPAAIVVPDLPVRAPATARGEHTETRYSRAPVADEVELNGPDRIALLTFGAKGRGEVVVLAGIAPAVWRSADLTTFDRLTAAAIAAYGEPDGVDARAAVRKTVDRLLRAGLLISHERA